MPSANNIRQILGRLIGNAETASDVVRPTHHYLNQKLRDAYQGMGENVLKHVGMGSVSGGLAGGAAGGLSADNGDRLSGMGKGMFAGAGLGALGGAGVGAAQSLKQIANITAAQQALRASGKESRRYQDALMGLAKRQFGSAENINRNLSNREWTRTLSPGDELWRGEMAAAKRVAERIKDDPVYANWKNEVKRWRNDKFYDELAKKQPRPEPAIPKDMMHWADWEKLQDAKRPSVLPFPLMKRSFDLTPKALSEFRAGMSGADIGSKVVPGLLTGGAVGLAKGLYEDPGYDDKTGKKKSRIMNALKNALGGAALGSGVTYLAGKPSSDFGARLGYNIGSKFGSDKQAAYLNWIGKAFRIKMAKHLLRMEDLKKQLNNFDFNNLTKAAMQGHSKAERLKYAALISKFLVEKQAFAAALSAARNAVPGLIRGATQFAENMPGRVANFIGGNPRTIAASAPTKVLSETGPGLYGRLNQALFPKQMLGQPGSSQPLLGRLNDAFFPKQTMKVSAEKRALQINIPLKAMANFIKARPVTSTIGGLAALPTIAGAGIGGIGGTLYGGAKGLYNTFAYPAAGLKDLGERFSASGQAFLNKGQGSSGGGSDGGYTTPYMPRGYVSKAYNYN